MKQAINGKINRMGLMIVRTNIINTGTAFTLAGNVDVALLLFMLFLILLVLGIEQNLSY